MKRELHQNLSRNEVCYTISLMMPVRNMLRSKLYCQIFFNSIPFSYEIPPQAANAGLRARLAEAAAGSTPGAAAPTPEAVAPQDAAPHQGAPGVVQAKEEDAAVQVERAAPAPVPSTAQVAPHPAPFTLHPHTLHPAR